MRAKFIDLSWDFSNDIPVYPGDPKVEIKQKYSLKKGGFSLHNYRFSGHCSTHIDAPAHFVEGGKTLVEIPLDNFSGEGIVIKALNSNVIDIDILNNIKVIKNQFVLFYTGFAEKILSRDYFANHPVLSEKLAIRLSELKVKMVGIDCPSPDIKPYTIHKILLSHDILIIENLCNLDKLPEKFRVFAFPLKVNTDGVPVRVVAEKI